MSTLGWGIVAAGLAGVAALLAVPPRATHVAPTLVRPAHGHGPSEPRSRRAPLERRRGAISLLAGAAPLLLVGGLPGLVAAVVVTAVVHRALGRREPAQVRRRREEIAGALPQVVDLLGVALAAGAAPTTALSTVAAAVGGPVAEDLRQAEHSLALGRDPVQVWRDLGQHPGLSALARTMARAVETGASVSDALHRLADDLHASSRLRAESRARTIGVRAAVPLGLCLLPAFVLVGVVPLVAGTIAVLLPR